MDIILNKKERENENRNWNNKAVLSSDRNMFFENRIARLLTTKETAEYLRSSPKQIRKWVYQGKIKSYKLCGKSLRFKMHDLDLLLKRGDQ